MLSSEGLQRSTFLQTWCRDASVREEESPAVSFKDLQYALRTQNIYLYDNCELMHGHVSDLGASKEWTRNELGEGDEKDFCSGLKQTELTIILKTNLIERSSQYSRGDIWIICTNPKFERLKRDDILIIAASLYHGASSNGILKMRILEGSLGVTRKSSLYALHGPRLSNELAMLDILRRMDGQSTPLLPLLIKPPVVPASIDDMSQSLVVTRLQRLIEERFQLNVDQTKVLQTISQWFPGSQTRAKISSQAAVCLVHGTFGAGKSHLLIAIVIFLVCIFKKLKDTSSRILISAATNVAVDRVLIGLLKYGFADFIRVGSFAKIAKSILPYSIQAAAKQDSAEKEAEQDLLQREKAAGPDEQADIATQLQELKDGKMKQRLGNLNKVRVVGVTCFSATNSILMGRTFKICLLDECSQMPEPLSLLPICTFQVEKLVAVGDPAQLPPVLTGGQALDAIGEKNDAETVGEKNDQHGLERAMFVRLAAMGHKPIFLRTQYRCHPQLTVLPNELFYGGRLLNGCSEEDRPPLIPNLPTLVFFDTLRSGFEARDAFKSFYNQFEAHLAHLAIRSTLAAGVSPSQIGVIVLYKAQAALIKGLVAKGGSSSSSERKSIVTAKELSAEPPRLPCRNFLNSEDASEFEGTQSEDEVQVSTVDAFQGMEKDIIILSCCRTDGLGFVTSPQRLNVAITRARHHLIILGKASNLQACCMWRQFLQRLRATPGCYRPADSLEAMFQRPVAHDLDKRGLTREPTSQHNLPIHLQSTYIEDLNFCQDVPAAYGRYILEEQVFSEPTDASDTCESTRPRVKPEEPALEPGENWMFWDGREEEEMDDWKPFCAHISFSLGSPECSQKQPMNQGNGNEDERQGENAKNLPGSPDVDSCKGVAEVQASFPTNETACAVEGMKASDADAFVNVFLDEFEA